MKKLILLRHAKSSWDDPALDDHDRPLNQRGRRAAPIIGAWLAANDHVPELILCSSSLRTRQTVCRLRKSIADLPAPVIEPDLYHATPTRMLDCLKSQPVSIQTVMVVGHQPGIGSLAHKLSDGTETESCRRAFQHFPTAAAAVFCFKGQKWSDLRYESAQFVDYAVPRELKDA